MMQRMKNFAKLKSKRVRYVRDIIAVETHIFTDNLLCKKTAFFTLWEMEDETNRVLDQTNNELYMYDAARDIGSLETNDAEHEIKN
jgi:hypothetical protein